MIACPRDIVDCPKYLESTTCNILTVLIEYFDFDRLPEASKDGVDQPMLSFCKYYSVPSYFKMLKVVSAALTTLALFQVSLLFSAWLWHIHLSSMHAFQCQDMIQLLLLYP